MEVRERKSLLSDYKSVYNKAPASTGDWSDLAKMASGSTPSRVLANEVQAIQAFTQVFNRAVDFSVKSNESFVHMVAYKLRPEARDVAKERGALGTYTGTYKSLPGNSFGWAVLKAIAYSGVADVAPVAAPVVAPAPTVAPVETTVASVVPVKPASAERNLKAEILAVQDFTSLVGASPDVNGWNTVYFISYGSTVASKAQTSAERLATVQSYFTANGVVPTTASEWENLVK
ncbi:hypothetical protein HOL46_02015 [Candidatus Falkowbacteria bacterium]|nr:hypothetical protein [Candidatus Falkowbacteria bacterium]